MHGCCKLASSKATLPTKSASPVAAIATALLSLWLARLLVSGSYYSLWDLLWYSRAFPGPLPVMILVVASLATPRLGGAARHLTLAPIAVLAVGDDSRLLALTAAIAMPAVLSALRHHAAANPYAPAAALAVEGLLRALGGGVEPVELALGRALLAALAVYTWLEYRPGGATLLQYVALAYLTLGTGYASGILRLAGFTSYGPLTFSIVSFSLVLASMTLSTPLILRAPRIAVLTILGFGPLGASIDGLAGLALLAASAGMASRLLIAQDTLPLGGVVGPAFFIAIAVAGVAVYTYPYLGLWQLADRMELVMLFTALVAGGLWNYKRERVKGPFPGMGLGRGTAAGIVPVVTALLTVILAFATQPPPIEPASSGGGVLAATYNLHQGFDAWGRFNGLEVASVVESLAREGYVICMQEVDGGRLTSSFIDIPLALAWRGISVAYQPAIEGSYGVAIAAGGSVETIEGFLLTSAGEQRAGIKSRALGVVVANAHLGLDPDERAVQAQEFLEKALSTPEAAIICGDFNEEKGRAIDAISKHYLLSDPEGPTCCIGAEEQVVIDYVGVRRGWGIIAESRVLEAASDHYLVASTIIPTGGG